MTLKPKNSWIPWVLYPTGDLIAQFILGEFQVLRLMALSLVGGLVYQQEVPRWFQWLDQRSFTAAQVQAFPPLKWLTQPQQGAQPQIYRLGWFGRTLGAMLYFSPLWITRHMLILKVATTAWGHIAIAATLQDLWLASCKSFLVNLPLSLLGNYIIQARLPLKSRFLGSIIMTGLMSIAFALAYRFF
ncbi:hypothetical protein [Vampirovibrio sp.]|uniref:hypothetical protein n=1 Tax=Vampirovibrio sp. TaxID=2717857 RepID=UPI003594388E